MALSQTDEMISIITFYNENIQQETSKEEFLKLDVTDISKFYYILLQSYFCLRVLWLKLI